MYNNRFVYNMINLFLRSGALGLEKLQLAVNMTVIRVKNVLYTTLSSFLHFVSVFYDT